MCLKGRLRKITMHDLTLAAIIAAEKREVGTKSMEHKM